MAQRFPSGLYFLDMRVPTKMKAAAINRFGGPDVLHLRRGARARQWTRIERRPRVHESGRPCGTSRSAGGRDSIGLRWHSGQDIFKRLNALIGTGGS